MSDIDYLGQDPVIYGDAKNPVRQDPWEYIIDVHWGGAVALVDLPISSFAPLGCYLVPLDADGERLFPGEGNQFFPNGKSYERDQLIKKSDYTGPFLTTTGSIAEGTSLSDLGSTVGLREGISYFITGPGIQAKTFFTFDGMSGGTLSAAATPSTVPVPVAISDWVFQPFNTDQSWVSPPVFWLYTYSGVTGTSGYWGGPVNFPLDRFDSVAETEDVTGVVGDLISYLGPALPIDYFDPVAIALLGGGDAVDFFFTNWYAHDDTVGGPQFHTGSKFGPSRANWNRDWYLLTYFAPSGNDTLDYRGWPLEGSFAPFTLSGSSSGDGNYPEVGDYPTLGKIFIWQKQFPTAAWVYQYLVPMSKLQQVKIMQLDTHFAGRQISLGTRIPGYSGGAKVRMFSSATRFFLDGTGRLNPVKINPSTGEMLPVTERWSRVFGIASSLTVDTELGRFDRRGPV